MKRILLLTCLLLAVFCACAAAEEEPLFIAQEGMKQGFINKAGEWVIRPEYTCVWPFTDAGYAAVEKESSDAFRLIDRQGKTVADLPEWRLHTHSETDGDDNFYDVMNAAGSAFVLKHREEAYRYALYMADSGTMTELDRDFLGYTLSPGAEINEAYYQDNSIYSIKPWSFMLAEWNERMILTFLYNDYTWTSSPQRHTCFVVLDRQGRKLHDGCFDGNPGNLMYSDEPMTDAARSYRIKEPFLAAGRDGVYDLIDGDIRVVMADVDPDDYWDEDLQALYHAELGAEKPDGETITEEECRRIRAEKNPCGITMVKGKYYDTQGRQVEWPELGDYEAYSGFCDYGTAWIWPEDSWDLGEIRLVNVQGQVVADNAIPIQGNAHTLFPDGWECVHSMEWSGFGYLNAAGELMYGGFVFDNAEPFQNGLARIKYLDENLNLLDGYIDTEGRIVWAENGRREEIQRWLDEGIKHDIRSMTADQARKKLAGEWDCTGGGEFIGYPIVFNADGTCDIGTTRILLWDIVENTFGEDVFWNLPPFILIFGDEDGFEKPEAGLGISFNTHKDGFDITDSEGGGRYIRVPEGYWKAAGYYVKEPDENGKIDQLWARDTVLPAEPPAFGLTDRSAPEGTENKGVYAFRGSPYRQNASAGRIRAVGKPELLWEADIGPAETTEDPAWQPLIAEWADETRENMISLYPEKQKEAGLTEVVAVGTDGIIHFADLHTGEETRPAVDGGPAGLHGTAALSPGLPLLFVPSKDLGFTCDLTDCSRRTEADVLPDGGWDGKAVLYQDGWLLTDSWGYHGILAHLYPEMADDGTLKITDVYQTYYEKDPITKGNISADGNNIFGMSGHEVCRYNMMTDEQRNYGDECWLSGEIFTAIGIDHPEQGSAALYIGSGLEKGYMFRVNADTMEVDWGIQYDLDENNPYVGGTIASPVIGQEGLADLVYFTLTGLAEEVWTDEAKGNEAALMARDKENGDLRWALPMKARAVSSPVAVYTEEGRGYLIQIDCDGTLYAADGLTGELLYSCELGGEVTTSPAVYRNILAVRCRKGDREVLCGVRIGE